MGQQKGTNGAAPKGRPLTKIIEKEKDIVENSDDGVNPNFAGHFDDREGVIRNLKQQLDSLQKQIDFLSDPSNGTDKDRADDKDDDADDRRVARQDLSETGRDIKSSSRRQEDDSDTMLNAAREKLGEFLDPRMVSQQISELRNQISHLSDRIPVDRSSIRSFKDDVVAPAISAALPPGLGKIGETAVRKASLDTLVRYGIPATILVAAIKMSSSKSTGGSS